jgi:hypothetical protein
MHWLRGHSCSRRSSSLSWHCDAPNLVLSDILVPDSGEGHPYTMFQERSRWAAMCIADLSKYVEQAWVGGEPSDRHCHTELKRRRRPSEAVPCPVGEPQSELEREQQWIQRRHATTRSKWQEQLRRGSSYREVIALTREEAQTMRDASNGQANPQHTRAQACSGVASR